MDALLSIPKVQYTAEGTRQSEVLQGKQHRFCVTTFLWYYYLLKKMLNYGKMTLAMTFEGQDDLKWSK